MKESLRDGVFKRNAQLAWLVTFIVGASAVALNITYGYKADATPVERYQDVAPTLFAAANWSLVATVAAAAVAIWTTIRWRRQQPQD
ncbi:MAG: hypothetical protein Q4C81_09340 [Kocuria sp.]|nr:hypothetical protein [Kocuria sp.]